MTDTLISPPTPQEAVTNKLDNQPTLTPAEAVASELAKKEARDARIDDLDQVKKINALPEVQDADRDPQRPEATMPIVPEANTLNLRDEQPPVAPVEAATPVEAARAQVAAQAPEAPVAPAAPVAEPFVAPEAAPVEPVQAAPAPSKKWWQKLLGSKEK